MKRDRGISDLIEQGHQRQQKGIELTASKNSVGDEVIQAMGSYMTNGYVEGYPSKRYHDGCEVVDESESLATEHVKKLFGAEYTSVQPHLGAQADMTALFTCLRPGDTFMGLNLDCGSHLSYGSPVSSSDILYNPIGYNLSKETGTVSYDEIEQPARQHKLKLTIAGGSACCRRRNRTHLRKVADEIGVIFMVGMTHPADLTATGLLKNPAKYAHIATSTTYKTLRGPCDDIILIGKDSGNPWGFRIPKGAIKMMSRLLNSAVFPGIRGSLLEHVITAKVVVFGGALDPLFGEYQKQVMKNAKTFDEVFIKIDYNRISGGTNNHCLPIGLCFKYPDLTGKVAENALACAGITVNKDTVPFDSRFAFQTSGIRVDTPAITMCSVKEDRVSYIVEPINRVLHDPEGEAKVTRVRREVNEMVSPLPIFA